MKKYFKYAFSVIYFVLHNPYPRTANETKNCPLGLCPIIKFTLEGGDSSDADCRSRIYTADQMKLEPEVDYTVKKMLISLRKVLNMDYLNY